MIRPLQAVNLVHRQMGETLETDEIGRLTGRRLHDGARPYNGGVVMATHSGVAALVFLVVMVCGW